MGAGANKAVVVAVIKGAGATLAAAASRPADAAPVVTRTGVSTQGKSSNAVASATCRSARAPDRATVAVRVADAGIVVSRPLAAAAAAAASRAAAPDAVRVVNLVGAIHAV